MHFQKRCWFMDVEVWNRFTQKPARDPLRLFVNDAVESKHDSLYITFNFSHLFFFNFLFICSKILTVIDGKTNNFNWRSANCYYLPGGGQNLERPNVERPIFRKFETSNIEITKVVLFDFSISEFILYFYDCLNYSNTQNTYLIIYHQIRNFLNFDSFTNCQIFKIC